MPTYEAGDARIRVIPDTSRFLTNLENDLKRKRAEFAVDVTADTAAAAADIDAFLARQSGRDITVGVSIDRRRAQQNVLDTLTGISSEVGNAFSAAGGALKVPLIFAGIGELPAAALAIANVAGALQQLAGAGAVLPGVIGGIAASFGTAQLGVSGVADAFTALQDASDGTEKSLEKADEALKKLAPSAQDAVRAASDVTKELRDALQLPIQQNLFAGVSGDLRALVANDLPVLQKGLGGISTALNQNLRQVLTSLGSDSSTGMLDRILGNTADAQGRFTKAIDPIITAVGTLTAAGTDALPRLADGLAGVSQRFEKFITEADQDGSLDKFINDGITGVGHLGDTILSLGKVFGDITKAAGGDGGLLKLLDDGAAKLHAFLSSSEGQNQLKTFFEEGRRELQEHVIPLLQSLPGLFEGLYDAGRTIADTVVPPLRDIATFLGEHPHLVQLAVAAFVGFKTITAVGELATSLGAISTLLSATLPTAAATGAAGISASLGPVAATIAAITAGIPIAFALTNPGPIISRRPDETLDQYLARQNAAGNPTPGLAPVAKPAPPATDTGALLGAPPAPPPPAPVNPRTVQGPFPGPSGNPFAPGGALGTTGFIGPVPTRAAGGPITGPGAKGKDSIPIMAAPGEHMLTASDVERMGGQGGVYRFRQALQAGNVPGLAGGGDPLDYLSIATGGAGGPAPGPIAPTTDVGGVSSITNSFLGVLGNIPGLGGGAASTAGDTGTKLTPGLAGLFQAGDDPDLLSQFGSQTGDYLGTFAAKTLSSFASTLYQGVLGVFGLENSILSPNNSYFQAATKSAGFFLGNDGPFAGGDGGKTQRPATDKQLREGSQSVGRADQRVAEILQRIDELPSDAMQSKKLALDNDLANARQDAADARADLQGLQVRGSTGQGLPGNGELPRGVGDEKGLQVKTIAAKRAISAAFPQITEIGGYRQDALKWHPNGLAIDVMIPGGDTAGGANPQGKALGDQIYAYVNANKQALGVDYVLWQQKDHFNHLHVNTIGGGYPQVYATGGGVAGTGLGDTVPALLTPGEHVLTTKDVAALGGQAGVYSFRDALHFAVGGDVPLGALVRPQPPKPPKQAQFLKPRPVLPPVAPATLAPPPSAAPPVPPPTAVDPTPKEPLRPPTPPASGPAPIGEGQTTESHTLPAISKGISSGFATAGSIAQTAAAVASFGAAGLGGGALAGGGGGGGPSIAGLFQQASKVANDVVDVGSAFLVGNITPGTTDNAYGETLRPQQKTPITAPLNGGGGATYKIEAGYRPADIIDAIRLKESQDMQARLARFG